MEPVFITELARDASLTEADSKAARHYLRHKRLIDTFQHPVHGADQRYRRRYDRKNSPSSRPAKPESGKIAVKVINHYGDEVLKVFEVSGS